MECKFCNNNFKTKSSLNLHQKSARYCVNIQNLGVTKEKFPCKFCGNKLSSKQRLETHISTCNANSPLIRKLLNEKDREIQNLKDKINLLNTKHAEEKAQIYKEFSEKATNCVQEIAKQPRVQNNTQKLIISTPFDLEKQDIRQAIKNIVDEKFSEDYFLDGAKGVARFMAEHVLKDDSGNLKYICTDPARNIFRYKNEEGDIRKDVKAKKLTSAFTPSIVPKSHSLASGRLAESDPDDFLKLTTTYQDIREIQYDNGVFRGELASLTVKK